MRQLRRDHHHKATCAIAKTGAVVKVETRNASGMIAEQAAGALRLGCRHGRVYADTGYQCAWHGAPCVKVDPACTSQACSRCGHTAPPNRPAQAVLRCGTCEFQVNAAPNAAIPHPGAGESPARPRSLGAARRRGAFPPRRAHRPATGTPATREPDMRGVNQRIQAPKRSPDEQ